jgi:hypothetical protein
VIFLLSLSSHAKGKSMNKTIGLFQHLFEEIPKRNIYQSPLLAFCFSLL